MPQRFCPPQNNNQFMTVGMAKAKWYDKIWLVLLLYFIGSHV
jgi:hypothetical protein